MWQKWYELQPNIGWSPVKTPSNVNSRPVVQTVLWIIDSGCSKRMTGDRSLLKIFVEKFIGIVRFRNDHFATITSYGDYVQEGDDLLIRDRESNWYTISIPDMAASSPVCLMYKATLTKSWLWHRRLSHLNFESMNILSKEDLDNLFEPMYEEYFEKRSSKMSINSTTQQVHNHEDSPSTSSIVVEEQEAPPIVTTSKEQTSPISFNEADEFNQEDFANFDGNTVFVPYVVPNFEEAELSTIALGLSNMHELHQVQPSTHIWTKAHPLEQVISDPSKPVMTRNRL
ncbi:integrase, catalytic region, zinc finger, CCHC-type containing protein [Tanacetum coccineum]